MDCPGTCDECPIKFTCYTEGKNTEPGLRTDSVVIEDKDEFLKLAKLWGKDWLVKAGKGLEDVSEIL